ncbi:MAG: Tll0287-like domain-containing protein [Nitrospiraceae bacterium]
MITKGLGLATVSILIGVLGYWGTSSGAKDCGGIPAERVADMVHAVIESNRTFYTVHVVNRMQEKGVVVASENWRSEKTLPLPAQFLQETARLAVNSRAKIGYKLIGLWPINKNNEPKNASELKGLMETQQHPDRPYTEVVMNGPDAYLQAIYADRAISQACIGCHNAHPDSPRHDFKQNDVMGAIMITVPLSL